jgi:hypothetical protein
MKKPLCIPINLQNGTWTARASGQWGHNLLHTAASLVAAAIALATAGSPTWAAQCKPLHGQLHSHLTSPTTISGTLTGGLQADFDVALTSQTWVSALDPTVPPQAAFVALVTGQTEFRTKSGGALFGVNAAAGDFDPGSDGHLTDLITFTGGSGDLSGASGHIVVVGRQVDSANGVIEARYSGELCTPDGD